MTKSKKILYIFTAGVIIFLIVCTFLSEYIYDSNMPVVEVIKPVSVESDGSSNEMIVPSSAVVSGANNTKNVYIVRQRKGLFGIEYYAVLLEVSAIADDDISAVIGGRNVTVYDDVVISPPNNLTSGAVVKVINK